MFKRLPALFIRRERLGLSWLGRLLLFLSLLVASIVLLLRVHPFLAVTHRVPADVLVVEGWLDNYAIVAAAEEFRAGHYARVLATGGPIAGLGGYINDYQTSASLGAQRLRGAGVSEDRVEMVPSRVSTRDRTFGSARALAEWIRAHGSSINAVNVITSDVHARRTRLLFQEALGPQIAVGVIAIPNPDYDAKRWWRYSEGVREILGESLAYLYATLLFSPD